VGFLQGRELQRRWAVSLPKSLADHQIAQKAIVESNLHTAEVQTAAHCRVKFTAYLEKLTPS
jgi:hypothetical protein